MNNNLGILYAFLGGAIVGAGAALLFAPEKGADLRKGMNSFRATLTTNRHRSAEISIIYKRHRLV